LFPKDPSRPEDWLTDVEAAALQEWLDSDGRGIVAPITTGKASEANLRLAHELITFYTRHRHDDWSAEFIRREFANESLPHYPDWQEDLITLCRSHHQYYDDLASAQFDPKPAGSYQKIVHLRYLACVLRVADVLDVDPERTPEVIFRHRCVAPGSELHWRKGHVTWIHLIDGTAQVSLMARPEHAVLERAIRETADAIGTELQVCARLAREQPFEHCSFSGAQMPQYIWVLPAWLNVDIHPQPNAYVYIDGAFRPNTERLLSLFAGTALYSQKFDAVRELLQNAFDAVREAIAYERLADRAKTPSIEKMLAQKHLVQLRLEADATPAYLVCSDTGAGMNREIIEKHLLVSGTGQRREILELERRCESAGFSLGRTGRFGIGVLAYFMLAKRIEITTRRYQGAEGDEGHGWSFESDGVGSFGELRVTNRRMPGSEIKLVLRDDEISDAVDWFEGLKDYLLRTIVHLPCRFEFTTTLPTARPLSCSPGWALSPKEVLVNHLAKALEPRKNEDALVSRATREAQKASAKRLSEAFQEACDHLQWTVSEGDLPEKFGRFRIVFPFFRIRDDVSLPYISIETSNDKLQVNPIGQNEGVLMEPATSAAWRGMVTSGLDCDTQHAFVDIDLTSGTAGELKIDRSHVSLTQQANTRIAEFIAKEEEMLIEDYWVKSSGGKFALLDSVILRKEITPTADLCWLRVRSRTEMYWEKIQFPATDEDAVDKVTSYYRAKQILWGNRDVSLLPRIDFTGAQYSRNRHTASKAPWVSKALVAGSRFAVVPVWEHRSVKDSSKLNGFSMAIFPPNWPVIGFTPALGTPLWNRRHPILVQLDVAAWDWAALYFKSSLNPLPVRSDLLQHSSRAAAWLLHVFADDVQGPATYRAKPPNEIWTAIIEQDPEFLKSVWKLIFGTSRNKRRQEKPIVRVASITADIVTPSAWLTLNTYKEKEEVRRFLPEADDNWTCKIVK
jgi:hypothetical protein